MARTVLIVATLEDDDMAEPALDAMAATLAAAGAQLRVAAAPAGVYDNAWDAETAARFEALRSTSDEDCVRCGTPTFRDEEGERLHALTPTIWSNNCP